MKKTLYILKKVVLWPVEIQEGQVQNHQSVPDIMDFLMLISFREALAWGAWEVSALENRAGFKL